MAIFDEQILEPFVAKGIGNSGVASRQVQATNLPDLSAAVRQSAATQQNLSDQQKSLSKAQGLVSMSSALGKMRGPRGGGGGGDNGADPVIFTQTADGKVYVAYTNGEQLIQENRGFGSIEEANSYIKGIPGLANAPRRIAGGSNLSKETVRDMQKFGIQQSTVGRKYADFAALKGENFTGGGSMFKSQADPVKLDRIAALPAPEKDRLDLQNELAGISNVEKRRKLQTEAGFRF